MPNPLSRLLTSLLFGFAFLLAPSASGQSRIGAQVKVSTLGIGGEIGIQVLPKANVRAGFNALNPHGGWDSDGVSYDIRSRLRSLTANFDWYLVGPLHISPGVLLYNGFKGTATASVPGGNTFTLGGTTYQSSAASPLSGTLAVTGNRVAPEIVIGLGNLVPRSGRRITFNFDFGIVFQGSPESALALTGFACAPPNSTGPTCVNAATNSSVQANMRSQEIKLNDDLYFLRYYPVISFGIGYRF